MWLGFVKLLRRDLPESLNVFCLCWIGACTECMTYNEIMSLLECNLLITLRRLAKTDIKDGPLFTSISFRVNFGVYDGFING